MCRRELGVWNFFPLTHVPSEQEEAVDKESPSYLDTGQIYGEERSRQRKADQEKSFRSGSNVEENTTEYSRRFHLVNCKYESHRTLSIFISKTIMILDSSEILAKNCLIFRTP